TTFMSALEKYPCPILFIGEGHVGPHPWDAAGTLDGCRQEARRLASRLTGLLPGAATDWVAQGRQRSVAAYLKEKGIGFIVLEPRADPFVDEEERVRQESTYLALRKLQHDGKTAAHLARFGVRGDQGHCTTAPAPDLLATAVPALQTLGPGAGV